MGWLGYVWTRAMEALETASRKSGLVASPGAEEAEETSAVVPREVLKKVRHIEIRTRSIVESLFCGEYHSVFKGQGMEFAEVREYQYGDDIRQIDWNVTARMNAPYVKKYREERELTLMLVVDASSSGAFGTKVRLKRDVAVELCALLAFSAVKNNDRVGLVIFTDRVEKYIPPKKGRSHVLRVLRELLYFRPEGKGTDLFEALSFVNRILKRRSVVFVISDFIAEGFEDELRFTAHRHDAVAVHVEDPRELELPDVGYVELEDPETGERVLVDTSDPALRKKFRTEMLRRRRALDETFNRMKLDVVRVATVDGCVDALVGFFKSRARRMVH